MRTPTHSVSSVDRRDAYPTLVIGQEFGAVEQGPVEVFVGLLLGDVAAALLRQEAERGFSGELTEGPHIKRCVGVVSHLALEGFEVGGGVGVFDELGKLGVVGCTGDFLAGHQG